jgi:hypothetical protein
MLRTSAGLLVLALMAACGKDTPAAPTPTSAIALSGNMNFGNITVGTTGTSTLTIANTGGGELTVTSVSYPSGFTGTFTSGTIAANGSQVVTVTFAPIAAQSYSGNITVAGNQASGTNTIAVSGAGRCHPDVYVGGPRHRNAADDQHGDLRRRRHVCGWRQSGETATTGADGRYQIPGLVNGGYTVSASKAGYTTVLLPVGINGNTILDFRLEPTAPRTSFGPGQYRVGPDIPAGAITAIRRGNVTSSACARSAARNPTPSSTPSSTSTPRSGSWICWRPTWLRHGCKLRDLVHYTASRIVADHCARIVDHRRADYSGHLSSGEQHPGLLLAARQQLYRRHRCHDRQRACVGSGCATGHD